MFLFVRFAIAGLRSLFGVLSQAMSDLVYLEQVNYTPPRINLPATTYILFAYLHGQTVGVILGLIAIKMGVESVGYHLLSPLQSLLLVVGILGTGVARSLSKKMSTKQ